MNSIGLKIKKLKLALGMAIFIVPALAMAIPQTSFGLTNYGFRAPVLAAHAYAPVASHSSAPAAAPASVRGFAPVTARTSSPVAAQSSAPVARPVAAHASTPAAAPVATQSSAPVARPVSTQSSAPVAAPTPTHAFAPVYAHVPVSVPNISSSIPLTFNGAGNLQNMISVQNAAPIALSTGVSILGTNSATGSAVGANATVAALTNNAGNGISNIQQNSGTNNDQTGLGVNTAAKSNIQNSASSASGGQLNINAGDGLNSNAIGSLTSTSIVTASQLNAGFKAPVVPAAMAALATNVK